MRGDSLVIRWASRLSAEMRSARANASADRFRSSTCPYGLDTASAGDAATNPRSRIPNPGFQGIVNAIGVDFIAAEIDGNGSMLAMVITSSIDTTSQLMLSSFTHRYAAAPTPGSYTAFQT